MKALEVVTNAVDHIVEIHSGSDGKKYLSGFDGKFMMAVLTALGLDYQIVVPEDREWGRHKPDGNWTGIIGMLARGEADMGFSLLGMSEERNQVVDFSRPYTSDMFTFVAGKPGVLISIFAYFYPFDSSIWAGILVSVLLLTSVCKLLDGDSSCGRNLFKFATSLLLQSVEMGDGTLKWRFLLGSWHFFVLFVITAYAASLLSFLTMPLHVPEIEDFHQLSLAVQRGTHRFCVLKGSIQLQLLLESPHEPLRILGKMVQRHKWYIGFQDVGSDKCIDQDSITMETRMLSNLFFGTSDKMLISKDSIAASPVAVALSKTFCCKSKLDGIISRLSSAGLYEKLLRDESFRLSLKHTFVTQSSKQLSIKDVSGGFAMLVVGLMVSIVALISEIVFYCLIKQEYKH